MALVGANTLNSADYGEEDPRIHFFAMREKLKEKGIDVEAIRDEVMSEVSADEKE